MSPRRMADLPLLSVILSLFALAGTNSAWADDGFFLGAGAAVFPATGTTVRMVSEDVKLRVEGRVVYAACEFVFVNDGPDADVLVGFPQETAEDTAASSLIRNFTVLVDGRETPYEVREGIPNAALPELEYRRVFVWTVRFPSKIAVKIEHAYNFDRSGFQGASLFHSLDDVRRIPYVLRTGALWSGTIGTARLTVDLGEPVPFENLEVDIPGFRYDNGVLAWELHDFEPEKDLEVWVHDDRRFQLHEGYACDRLGLDRIQGVAPPDRRAMLEELFAFEDEVRGICAACPPAYLDSNTAILRSMERRMLWLLRGRDRYERSLHRIFPAGGSAPLGLAKKNLFIWGPESFFLETDRRTIHVLDSVHRSIRVFIGDDLVRTIPLREDIDESAVEHSTSRGGREHSFGATDLLQDSSGNYYVLRPYSETVEVYRADQDFAFAEAAPTIVRTSGQSGRLSLVDGDVWVTGGEGCVRVFPQEAGEPAEPREIVPNAVPLSGGRFLRMSRPAGGGEGPTAVLLDEAGREIATFVPGCGDCGIMRYIGEDRGGRLYFWLTLCQSGQQGLYRFTQEGRMDLILDIPEVGRTNLIRVMDTGDVYAMVIGGIDEDNKPYALHKPNRVDPDRGAIYIEEWEARGDLDDVWWLDDRTPIESLSDDELRMRRNEIYARRGHQFDTREMRLHFGCREWYSPSSTGASAPFSPDQAALVEKIRRLEAERGATE